MTTALVTGANSGIGKETARALAHLGWQVILVCRNPIRGAAALAELRHDTGNEALTLELADMGVMTQVRALAERVLAKYDRLDVLVNNAGVYLPKRIETEEGFEATFAINHLGYFLLTALLQERLRASGAARIVNVSSEAHRSGRIDFGDLQCEQHGYSGMHAYANSKLANILFTYELARRLQGTEVVANCLHPGVVGTNIGRGYASFVRALFLLLRPVLMAPEKGAATSVYLASDPAAGNMTGQYFIRKKPVRSSPQSYDAEVARRLWVVSEALTDLS